MSLSTLRLLPLTLAAVVLLVPTLALGADADEAPPEQSSCTAVWTALPVLVDAGTWWSFATGEPQPDVFSLNLGCRYQRANPEHTPLILPPQQALPWTAMAGGVPVFVTNLSPTTGEITLATDVQVGATVRLDFYFEILEDPVPPPTPVPATGPITLAILAAFAAVTLLGRFRTVRSA